MMLAWYYNFATKVLHNHCFTFMVYKAKIFYLF